MVRLAPADGSFMSHERGKEGEKEIFGLDVFGEEIVFDGRKTAQKGAAEEREKREVSKDLLQPRHENPPPRYRFSVAD